MCIFKNFIFTVNNIVVVWTAHRKDSSRSTCSYILVNFPFLLTPGWWGRFTIKLWRHHLLKGLRIFVKALGGLLITTKQAFRKFGFLPTLICRINSITPWWKKLLDIVIQFLLVFISWMICILQLLLLLCLHLDLMIPLYHLLYPFSLLFFQQVGLLHLETPDFFFMWP